MPPTRIAQRWRFGIVAPLVTLWLPEGRRTGAGNPLLLAQYRTLERGPHALELGAQAEIPWATRTRAWPRITPSFFPMHATGARRALFSWTSPRDTGSPSARGSPCP